MMKPAMILVTGMKRRRNCRNRPVPRMAISIGGPHTMSLIAVTIEVIVSMNCLQLL